MANFLIKTFISILWSFVSQLSLSLVLLNIDTLVLKSIREENTYFQCISSLASMLFKTIDLKPFIREKNSSVTIPWLCARVAFFVDIWMICDSGTSPGQHFVSFLIT